MEAGGGRYVGPAVPHASVTAFERSYCDDMSSAKEMTIRRWDTEADRLTFPGTEQRPPGRDRRKPTCKGGYRDVHIFIL